MKNNKKIEEPAKLEEGFLLGDWRVEPMLNRLSSDRRTVTLEPQAMQVLVLLARRAGDVVSADDIVTSAWAGRPISDNPVYKTINKLRRGLGDDSRRPRYIATVTKRGYRLIAPVGPLPEVGSATPDGADGAGASLPGRWRLPLVAVAAVAAVALLAMGVLWLGSAPSENGQPRLRHLVNLPGSSSEPSFAPDGKQIVFVNDSDGTPDLWRLDLSAGSVERLTSGPAFDTSPAWSPDGARVAFERDDDIWVLEFGREPVRLLELGRSPAWSRDAMRLAFERNNEVWIATADGRNQRRVEAISNRMQQFGPRSPAFAPDGESLVYFDNSEGPLGDLWRVDLTTGKTTRLTFDVAQAGAPTFTADGRWIVFHSSRTGATSVWRIPAAGGIPEPLIQGSGNDTMPAVAPDGGSIVYAATRPRSSLMVTDPAGPRAEVLFESRYDVLAPELSPDGSQLVFFSVDGERGVQVFVQSTAGGSARPLTAGVGSMNVMPKWSADGEWVYFYHSGESSSWQRVSVEGGEPEVVVGGWQFNNEHDATIDPNGGRAIYARLQGNSVIGTLLKDLATGAEYPFAQPISWFDWSSDGSRLLATNFAIAALPVGPLVLCDMSTGGFGRCEQIAARGQHPVWAHDEQSMYFVDPLNQTTLRVWRYTFTTGGLEHVTDLAPAGADLNPFIDVTADGHLVWVRHEQGRSELWQARWR